MPPVTAANQIYTRGYLNGALAGGSVYDRVFGELQDFTLDSAFDLVKLHGPSRRTAIGVGIGPRTITGTAKHAKIRARIYNLLHGSAVAKNASYTVVSGNATDEPLKFDVQFITPANGEDLETKLFGCLSPSLNLPFASDTWVIPGFTFECFGDATGKLYDITLPGDQTAS